ncbi:hypothetical protein C7M61_003159 [Candidozyma pseudohaemuli]|uniref:Uncharacterized protein n=1 Tax=Candidozyma pseudohaemuli TaxID=418784 RepID=A0A2P7YPM3_9ASCO|nr:hypothetical protein C7M61_003159 [[Candida] pseudohaemulonii]PSK37909.1 hypothetical protein C7M61_003159 [[Candida] pseudohaemulonii]
MQILNVYGARPHGPPKSRYFSKLSWLGPVGTLLTVSLTIDFYLKAYNVPTDGKKDRSTPALVSLMSFSAMMALLYLLTNVLVRRQWKRLRKYNELVLLSLFCALLIATTLTNTWAPKPAKFKPVILFGFLTNGGLHALGCLYYRHNRVVRGNRPLSWKLNPLWVFPYLLVMECYFALKKRNSARQFALGGAVGVISQFTVETVVYLYKRTLGEWRPALERRKERNHRRGRRGGRKPGAFARKVEASPNPVDDTVHA